MSQPPTRYTSAFCEYIPKLASRPITSRESSSKAGWAAGVVLPKSLRGDMSDGLRREKREMRIRACVAVGGCGQHTWAQQAPRPSAPSLFPCTPALRDRAGGLGESADPQRQNGGEQPGRVCTSEHVLPKAVVLPDGRVLHSLSQIKYVLLGSTPAAVGRLAGRAAGGE